MRTGREEGRVSRGFDSQARPLGLVLGAVVGGLGVVLRAAVGGLGIRRRSRIAHHWEPMVLGSAVKLRPELSTSFLRGWPSHGRLFFLMAQFWGMGAINKRRVVASRWPTSAGAILAPARPQPDAERLQHRLRTPAGRERLRTLGFSEGGGE